MSKSNFIKLLTPPRMRPPGLGVQSVESWIAFPRYINPSFPDISVGPPYYQLSPRSVTKSYAPQAWGFIRSWEGVSYRYRRVVDSGHVPNPESGNYTPIPANWEVWQELEWNEENQTADVIEGTNDGEEYTGEIIDQGKDFITRRATRTENVYGANDELIDTITHTYDSTRTWTDEIVAEDLPAEVNGEALNPAQMSQVLRQKMWLDHSDDSQGWPTVGSILNDTFATLGLADRAYKTRVGALLPTPLPDATLKLQYSLVKYRSLPQITSTEYFDPAPGDGGADEFGFIDPSALGFGDRGWASGFGNTSWGSSSTADHYGQIRVDLIDPPVRDVPGTLQVRLTKTVSGYPPEGENDETVTLPLGSDGKSTVIEYFAPKRTFWGPDYDEDTGDPLPGEPGEGEGEFTVTYSAPTLLAGGSVIGGATFAFRVKRRLPRVALGWLSGGIRYRTRRQTYSGTNSAGEEVTSQATRVIVNPLAQGPDLLLRVETEMWEEHYLDPYGVGSDEFSVTDQVSDTSLYLAPLANTFTGMLGSPRQAIFRPIFHYW